MPRLTTTIALTFLVATFALTASSTMLAKTQAAEKKKDPADNWKSVLEDSGSKGGHRRFTLKRDTEVRFIWDTKSSHRTPNFRITLAKRNPRTREYETKGVIVREHRTTKGSKKAKLKAGDYQVYIAIKRVSYKFTVKAEKAN